MNSQHSTAWQQGFAEALNMVTEAINRNRAEADRDGDNEYLEEKEAGWADVENIIDEIKGVE